MAKENNKPTEQSLFEKALNFQIPKDKIETIESSGRPLSYVSWAYAWGMFKQIYPDANYRIIKNENGLPYFADPNMGIMCYTEMTAGGETHEMWLLVMDSKNRSMRMTPQTIQKWNKYKKTWEEEYVAAATMFDVNKTLMRCLVKNMAMFGFGLNIYNGDDLPEFDIDRDSNQEPAQKPAARPRKAAVPEPTPVAQNNVNFGSTLDILANDPYAGIKQILANLKSIDEMMALYNEHKTEVESNADIKTLFGIRKGQIKKQTA